MKDQKTTIAIANAVRDMVNAYEEFYSKGYGPCNRIINECERVYRDNGMFLKFAADRKRAEAIALDTINLQYDGGQPVNYLMTRP